MDKYAQIPILPIGWRKRTSAGKAQEKRQKLAWSEDAEYDIEKRENIADERTKQTAWPSNKNGDGGPGGNA